MERTPINPWPWSLKVGYKQAEVVTNVRRNLYIAGQTSVDSEGNPQHLDNIRGQISLALDNLEAVLAEAQMTLKDIVRLGVYA